MGHTKHVSFFSLSSQIISHLQISKHVNSGNISLFYIISSTNMVKEGKIGSSKMFSLQTTGISEDLPVQTPAFTNAVRLYRQAKGHYGTWDMMCGQPPQVRTVEFRILLFFLIPMGHSLTLKTYCSVYYIERWCEIGEDEVPGMSVRESAFNRHSTII